MYDCLSACVRVLLKLFFLKFILVFIVKSLKKEPREVKEPRKLTTFN